MGSLLRFDYFYGIESEQFSFYRIPRLLVKDGRFRDLSSDAKLLYGLMLDRMGLSIKNGWVDEENRAYIYYTLDNIMEDLGCAREKCAKVLAELDSKKGIGLIQKKRQGLGRPDIIYVMNFATLPETEGKDNGNADDSAEVRKSNFKKFENRTSGSSETESQEVRKPNFRKFGNRISGSSETESQEVRLPNPNYNNDNSNNGNYTDVSYTNPINPRYPLVENADNPAAKDGADTDGIDRKDETNTYMAMIRENLEYEHHMRYAGQYGDSELFEEIYETICEVVCVKRKMIRINGEEYPYELVKSRFLKLNSAHVEYVMACLKDTTVKIGNIRAYLITALYNAPSTMNLYYQQEVQHDRAEGG